MDYNAGLDLTAAVNDCRTALATLQRLGRSDQADGPLTDAESSSNYAALDADRDHSDAWKLQRYAQTYFNVITTLARRLTSVANAAGKQDADDAANVFGIAGLPGDVASLSIARRDAGDRIDDITDPSQRQALLAQAVRTVTPPSPAHSFRPPSNQATSTPSTSSPKPSRPSTTQSNGSGYRSTASQTRSTSPPASGSPHSSPSRSTR